jgi:hypothetical protein
MNNQEVSAVHSKLREEVARITSQLLAERNAHSWTREKMLEARDTLKAERFEAIEEAASREKQHRATRAALSDVLARLEDETGKAAAVSGLFVGAVVISGAAVIGDTTGTVAPVLLGAVLAFFTGAGVSVWVSNLYWKVAGIDKD